MFPRLTDDIPSGANHCILPSAGVLEASSLISHHGPAARFVQLRCLMIRFFFIFLSVQMHHIPPAGRREFRILMSTLYVPCIMHAQLAAVWRYVAKLPPSSEKWDLVKENAVSDNGAPV